MSRPPAAREVWTVDVRPWAPYAAGDAVIALDSKRQVAAFDGASGAPRWAYPFASFVLGIHGRHVLARAGHDEIHVLDAASGRPDGCIPHHLVDTTIVDGDVLFASRKPGWGEEALVTAVDLASARRLWMHVGEAERTPGNHPSAFAVGGGAVVTGESGAVLVLDARTGAVRWRRSWPEWEELDGEEMMPPKVDRVFIDGARVIAAVGRHVVCLSLDDGRPLWDAEGPLHLVDGGRAYATERDRYHVRATADGSVRRREASSGGPKTLPNVLRVDSRVGAVDGGHAYLLAGHSQGEALVAVDREKGRYAWHHQPPGGHHATAPVFEGGRVYYVNASRLYCLEPPS